MHWQDLILTIGSIIFTLALIPSVMSKDKPALSSSLLTGAVLLVFAGVYASLALWFSMVTTVITGLVWLLLAYQKFSRG